VATAAGRREDCGRQRDDENTRRTIHSRKTEPLIDTVRVRLHQVSRERVCIGYGRRLFYYLNIVYDTVTDF